MTHSTHDISSFEDAFNFWSTWSSQDVDEAGVEEQFHRAEQSILSHDPRTPQEAAIQLSLVIEAMSGGGRSDGLDIDVVRRVQTWLRQLVETQSN